MRKDDKKCAALGYKAIDLVRLFPTRFRDISYFYFKSYSPADGIEVRLDMKEVRSLAAVSIRQLLKRHPDAHDLVGQMLKDIDVDESKSWIKVCAADFGTRLSELEAQTQADGKALALYSLCRDKNGGKWHIPMMDFRVESGDDVGQMNVLTEALSMVCQTDGVLLNSGKSYHYYGFKLLKNREWTWFMTACLLLEPLVDVRYISHRMLAGKAALRLTSAPPLKPKVPKVIACLQESLRGCPPL